MSTMTWDIRPAAPTTTVPALRLTRRGRRVVLGLAVALAVAVGLSAQSAEADGPVAATAVTAHTVAAGETLWEIAASVAGAGQDVRDVVDAIAELNGIAGGGLQAGQQILVPLGAVG
ncbi:MAG TPA: LysM peptidoglycan-binding domain-containing protein [Actinotalea sp.]|nr:LysM peptidoglycan-binding domain-containing protein [Actinotalea sp.]